MKFKIAKYSLRPEGRARMRGPHEQGPDFSATDLAGGHTEPVKKAKTALEEAEQQTSSN
jgi:hypothetical protein